MKCLKTGMKKKQLLLKNLKQYKSWLEPEESDHENTSEETLKFP
jgi:hypothetical protein